MTCDCHRLIEWLNSLEMGEYKFNEFKEYMFFPSTFQVWNEIWERIDRSQNWHSALNAMLKSESEWIPPTFIPAKDELLLSFHFLADHNEWYLVTRKTLTKNVKVSPNPLIKIKSSKAFFEIEGWSWIKRRNPTNILIPYTRCINKFFIKILEEQRDKIIKVGQKHILRGIFIEFPFVEINKGDNWNISMVSQMDLGKNSHTNQQGMQLFFSMVNANSINFPGSQGKFLDVKKKDIEKVKENLLERNKKAVLISSKDLDQGLSYDELYDLMVERSKRK